MVGCLFKRGVPIYSQGIGRNLRNPQSLHVMERTRTRGLVVVEWSRPSIDLVREVAYDSLAVVRIQTVPVLGPQGVYRAKVALTGDSTWIRIEGIDLAGNRSSDSVLVRRLAPPSVWPASAGLDSAIIVRAEAKSGVVLQYALGSSTSPWLAYAGGIEVTSSSRLCFRSVLGGAASSIVERGYVFAPRIKPGAKSFTVPESVSISPDAAASIEVSTDGSSWTNGTHPLVVSKTTKVFARVVGSSTRTRSNTPSSMSW